MSYARFSQVAATMVRNVVKAEARAKYPAPNIELTHKTKEGVVST